MLPMWKRRPRKVKDKSWVATEAPPLFLKDNQRSVCSLSSSDSFLHKFSQVLPSPDLTRPLGMSEEVTVVVFSPAGEDDKDSPQA